MAEPLSIPRGSLIRGLISQNSVVRAMILRELQSRFGRDNIGYLWVIAEPMLLASSITLIHVAAAGSGNSEDTGGLAVYPFTLLGYCVFIIFRNTFNRGEGMINGAASMLYHAQITPLDIVLSKTVVEALAALSALVVLMTAGIILGVAHLPVRPLYLLTGILAMVVFTFGLTMFIAATTYKYHAIGRLVHPFSYLMLPLSGAFITVSFLPPWARPAMTWNPYMNVFEMARYGFFKDAASEYFSIRYILACCAVSVYVGLLALRRVRREILVR